MDNNRPNPNLDPTLAPQIADLERRLRLALRHQPAPSGLRTRVLAQSQSQSLSRARRARQHGSTWVLQRLAASLVLAAVFAGLVAYRQSEERRKGEAARQQVLTALRITSHALQNAGTRANDHPDN